MADINRLIDSQGDEISIVDSELEVSVETINEATDISGALATLDIEHWFIHKGLHFFNSQVITVASEGVINWVIETGDKGLHMVFEVSATDGAISFTTYEGITANEDGTLQTLLNNNRLSTNTSTATMRLNPTGTDITGATIIRSGRAGTTGGTALRSGGSIGRQNELIFKKNSKYLLRVTNLANATNYIVLTHSWYENGL